MSNNIASELLDQAKKYLAKGDFEKAGNTARAILALEKDSQEAKDILKASEAVTSAGVSQSEDTDKTELRIIAVEVQSAINSKNFFKAEEVIKEYLVKYPKIPDAQQILLDVQKAHGNYNSKLARDRKLRTAQSQRRNERDAKADAEENGSNALAIGTGIATVMVCILVLIISFRQMSY